MPVEITFAKASGAGNDFVVLNNMDGRLTMLKEPLARALCARQSGIGADGLLVLEPSSMANFRMLYFNADGSFGGMCGNGGRCIALAAQLSGITGPRCRFEALDYVYEAEVDNGNVRLAMKNPKDYRGDIVVHDGADQYSCHAIDTGAPHAVVFVDDLEHINVPAVGRSVRNAGPFQPGGTNVNFVRVVSAHAIDLRTYERGVEAETLACGTGSIASAAVAVRTRGLQFPVDVHVWSGATLRVHARRSADSITDVVLEGPAEILFVGSVQYDPSTATIVAMKMQALAWEQPSARL
jgi:diaminopimelate epimerase